MMSIAATIQADQEPRRFRELRETLALEAASRTFYVNEYEVDQAFGGPEEGGWNYTYGRFIQCHGERQHGAGGTRAAREDGAPGGPGKFSTSQPLLSQVPGTA